MSQKPPPLEINPAAPIEIKRQSSNTFDGFPKLGCALILLLLFLVFYVPKVAIVAIPSLINLSKWNSQQIESYTFYTEVIWGNVPRGATIVINGQADTGFWGGNFTFNNLFTEILNCAFSPFYLCNVQYHPDYGYPISYEASCPMIDCYIGFQITSFEANR